MTHMCTPSIIGKDVVQDKNTIDIYFGKRCLRRRFQLNTLFFLAVCWMDRTGHEQHCGHLRQGHEKSPYF